MSVFPQKFIQQLQVLFSEKESLALLESLEQPAPISVRLNPYFKGHLSVPHEKIPQSENAYFLNERPLFTADPAFHAGAYYPQEANSMWIGAVFGFLRKGYFEESEGLAVLDLCAAPGGKTTDISSRLLSQDILVANEVISARNAILFENVCKWGLANTVITKADAQKFGQKGPVFDMVFCDAPCSGEGMFRKDNIAIQEWSEDNVSLCTQRQQRIVYDVWDALKPGGFMIYSTCTFNRNENEDNVLRICEEKGAEIIPFEHPAKSNLYELEQNMYRCLPHLSKGEGLFFCILRKPQESEKPEGREISPRNSKNKKLPLKSRYPGFTCIEKGNETYLLAGERDLNFIQNLPGIVHPGVPLGSFFNEKWKPHPAVALIKNAEFGLPEVELSDTAAMQFLKREFIPLKPKALGAVIVCWNGHRIGTANAVKNGLNNLLPMEWRVRGDFTAHSIVEQK